jgi:HK97 family phage portal protein
MIIDTLLSKVGLARASALKPVQKASGGEWGKLWLTMQENRLFGETVQRPYEQISNVYKAIKAITDNLPQADLKFYDKSGKNEITSDPIVDLFNSPNPLMTESEFVQAWVGFLVLYGEVNIIKNLSIGQLTGARTLPAELWIFNPSHFQEVIQNGQLAGWRYNAFSSVNAGIPKTTFTIEEVIHTKDFNPYSLIRGLAPTSPIKDIIDIDYKSLIFNKAFFDNDATPGMMLSTDEQLTETQINRLTEWMEKRHKGASKAFRMAVLEGGLKPVSIMPTHKDMDFIKQKEYARQEILGIWRVPQAFFNVTEGLNYATFIGQMKMFWNYTIMPSLSKMTDMLNKYVVRPYNPNMIAKFDLSNVVAYQEDFKEKVTTAQTLVAIGVPLNAVNEKLGLGFEDYPWGDEWWVGFGLQPAGKALEDALNPPEPTPIIPPNPDEAPAKAMTHKQLQRLSVWKGFLARQNPLENRLASVIKNYFYNQRRVALESVNKHQSDALMNWVLQDKELKDKVSPYILASLKAGIEHGKGFFGKKDFADDALDAKLESYLVMSAQKITKINQTVKNQMKEGLAEGVQAGETVMQLADRVRDIYNMAAGRAIMIARTETAGAVNGGSFIYYGEVGVPSKEWLTAGDEVVRESHQIIDGEVVSIEQRFNNGLRYPGDMDGEAGEVINCRCTILPVME